MHKIYFIFLNHCFVNGFVSNAPQAVERTGRSTLKEDYIPEDFLVLSCEEDYAICAPFLEKGKHQIRIISL